MTFRYLKVGEEFVCFDSGKKFTKIQETVSKVEGWTMVFNTVSFIEGSDFGGSCPPLFAVGFFHPDSRVARV